MPALTKALSLYFTYRFDVPYATHTVQLLSWSVDRRFDVVPLSEYIIGIILLLQRPKSCKVMSKYFLVRQIIP